MKMKFAALIATVAMAAQVQAHEVTFGGTFLGSSEVPASGSAGTGTATVIVDLDLLTMRVIADFGGLTGNVTASHIHCCTNPGTNVIVATVLPSFTGFPTGVTSGSYDNTFDMSLVSNYNPAFITANGGTIGTAFNALLTGLNDGRAYFNIHTSTSPGGEIRALLAPVPLPASAWLMLSGLLGMVLLQRRWQAQVGR